MPGTMPGTLWADVPHGICLLTDNYIPSGRVDLTRVRLLVELLGLGILLRLIGMMGLVILVVRLRRIGMHYLR